MNDLLMGAVALLLFAVAFLVVVGGTLALLRWDAGRKQQQQMNYHAKMMKARDDQYNRTRNKEK